MMQAIATENYQSADPEELDLSAGDFIKDVTRQGPGKLSGVLNGKTGFFPERVVNIKSSVKELKNKMIFPFPSKASSETDAVKRYKAHYSYVATQDDELSLQIGDIVEFLEEIEDGWWRGKVTSSGREGLFPNNFVKLYEEAKKKPIGGVSAFTPERPKPKETPTPEEKTPEAQRRSGSTTPDIEKAEVLFAYEAANEDELSLKIGDVVHVTSKMTDDPGWWTGELKGKRGMFPDNFVKLLPVPEKKKSRISAPEVPPKAISPLPITNGGSTPAATALLPSVDRPKGPMGRKQPTFPPSAAIEAPKSHEAPPLSPRLNRKSTDVTPAASNTSASISPKPARTSERVPTEISPPGSGDSRLSRFSQPKVVPPKVTSPEHAHLNTESHSVLAAEMATLRTEFQQLAAASVPRAEHEAAIAEIAQLKKSVESLRGDCMRRLAELSEELDEEKKVRLSTEIDIQRIKKLQLRGDAMAKSIL